MRSLRRNLMLGIAGVTTAIFICAAVAIFMIARSSLVRELDATTSIKASAVANMVEIADGKLKMDELEEAQMPEFSGGKRPDYFQLRDAAGLTLARSKSLASGSLWEANGAVRLPDGQYGRAVAIHFTPHGEDNQPVVNGPHLSLTGFLGVRSLPTCRSSNQQSSSWS